MVRKLALWAAMLALTGAAILAGIELIVPRVGPRDHITHHRFGNRPYALLPNAEHRAADHNYDVTFRANALGFNDVDHALEKAPGTYRVEVAVGGASVGSQTFTIGEGQAAAD